MEQPGQIILKDNMLLNFGDTYIVCNFLPEDGSSLQELKLKVFGGTASNKGEYSFHIT